MANCDAVILGAGSYGLAAANHLKEVKGLEVKIFGEPMAFWDRNMPEGMFFVLIGLPHKSPILRMP